MPRAGHPLDIHWRGLSRWCLFGTVVMALWLLWPTIKCSVTSFRETPLEAIKEGAEPSSADKDRVEEGTGFFAKWWDGTKRCYAATPLFGQEDWKTVLLLSFAGATVVTSVIARIANRKHGLE